MEYFSTTVGPYTEQHSTLKLQKVETCPEHCRQAELQ